MAVIPDSRIGKLEFCETHVPTWTTNAVAIGTTTTAVTALGTLTTAARAAWMAQKTAQDAAKNATNDFNMAIDAANTAAAAIIKQVYAKAATAGDSVYSLASIPVPATPSPVGPPGQPSDFATVLDGDGSLIITWKCVNPAGGTMYQVFRQIGGEGDFDYIGGSGEKKYVDTTIPAGATQLTYKVQAQRTTGAGMWATFNVYFGTNSGGTMTASVVETGVKKAA